MIFKLNCSLNKTNQNARDANIKTDAHERRVRVSEIDGARKSER